VIESTKIKIASSIASGPLISLERTIHDLENAGSSIIHFDIEDGNFVPVMNLGIKVIGELRPLTKLPFDVHLMMVNPEWLIPELAEMGANWVSVHYEACQYPRRTLRLITKHGMQAGLAFNPSTQIPDLNFCLPYLSFIVILTTEPEGGDCPFLPSVLNKIVEGKLQPGLRDLVWIVDGAISPSNAKAVVSAGADVLVIGRAVFKEGKIRENILEIKKAIED
jgi:ribulose-phosphate 3-epimerase